MKTKTPYPRLRPASVAPGLDIAKGYAYGVKAGNIVAIASQVGRSPDGTPVGPDIESQVEKIFQNIKAIVEEAGGTMEDVIFLSAYITDRSHAKVVQETRKRYFAGPNYPAASLVLVDEVLLPGYLAEISGLAVLRSES
jgi:2-iminobutanoate/2-iminopropanoate deaminase